MRVIGKYKISSIYDKSIPNSWVKGEGVNMPSPFFL